MKTGDKVICKKSYQLNNFWYNCGEKYRISFDENCKNYPYNLVYIQGVYFYLNLNEIKKASKVVPLSNCPYFYDYFAEDIKEERKLKLKKINDARKILDC